MYRKTFFDVLVGWAYDWVAAKVKMWKQRKNPPEIQLPLRDVGAARMFMPNFSSEPTYQEWLHGEWRPMNHYPDTELTVKSCGKPIDEILQVFFQEREYVYPLVLHTGHSEATCPGESLAEGLRKIFSNQESTWKIRYVVPWHGFTPQDHPNVQMLDLFLAQEFEGSEPGNPNRDICELTLNRDFAPMELEIKVPYRGVKDGIVRWEFLRIDLKIEPRIGAVVTGHEGGIAKNNTDPDRK